ADVGLAELSSHSLDRSLHTSHGERFSQLRQSESAKAKSDISKCDVEVLAGHYEVDGNQQQPQTGNVCAQPWPLSDHHQSDDHFDDPYKQHEGMTEATENTLRDRIQILVPIHQHVKELVQSG